MKQQLITEIDTRNQQTAGILGTTGCPGSSMIVQGESPIREALDRNRNLMDPKKTIKIGTWNVRTMYQVSKTAQVIREMERYQL